MKPEEPFSEEDKQTLAALGEIPAEEMVTEEGREKLRKMAEVVERLQTLYDPEKTAHTENNAPSEFQIARMEQARRLAGYAASINGKSHRPLWKPFTLVAAVLVLGVVLVPLLREDGSTSNSTIAQNETPADPYVGIRSGSPSVKPVANAAAEASALAPIGEIRTRQPLSFLWKTDPRVLWELRLYREGETKPLAKAEGAKSPFSIERLMPESGSLDAGGNYRWEVVNPASGEIATQAVFHLSQDAVTHSTEDSTARRAAMDAAMAEGRDSEALMLLFSLHNDLTPETFIQLRRELEGKILTK